MSRPRDANESHGRNSVRCKQTWRVTVEQRAVLSSRSCYSADGPRSDLRTGEFIARLLQLRGYDTALVTTYEPRTQTASNATAELNGSRAMGPEQQQRAITLTARAIVIAKQPYSTLLDTLVPDQRVTTAIEDAGR
jgi:hypothetical protein